MVNKRLIWELETRHLLLSNQFGFRRNQSTSDCLVILESKIRESFASGKDVVAIFFDLQNAYGMASAQNILYTLSGWGISGNILHFIKNFMTTRTFKLIMGNMLTSSFKTENGVPQGEILSVTLFLVAINGIESFIQNFIDYLIYADDITIYVASKNISEIEVVLQNAITNLSMWASRTGCKFSCTKTNAVHFTNCRKCKPSPKLLLNNLPINFVTEIKYLRVSFLIKNLLLNYK